MVDAIARTRGAHLERTMTGFKWLWSAALELLRGGARTFAIAWEEALGYSTHTSVRDKDGIAAGLIAADWVAQCHAEGDLPWRRLGALYRRHGAWASRQVNVHCGGADGAQAMRAALDRLGTAPPAALGNSPVARFGDYRTGAELRPDWCGAAELYALSIGDGARLLVRPSGTEPKLKLYVDVPGSVGERDEPFGVLESAGKHADRLAKDLIAFLGLDAP
jgi:phosphomannomutase